MPSLLLPEARYQRGLKAAGVTDVYGPGSSTETMVADIRQAVAEGLGEKELA